MIQSSKDLIIGAYTNYNWDNIKYWVNSIEKSGFTGDKAMIVYNSDQDTVQRLIDRGFKIYAFNRDQTTGSFFWPNPFVIVVLRFFHLWHFLNQLPENSYRYVISTDVKDVVFQTNPSKWLEANLNNKHIIASSESLLYKNEPWGNDNLKGSYPMIHDNMQNSIIWNCGVQAGTQSAIKDLWLQIYLLCSAGQRHNPDQAAYNLLLNSVAWSNITKFTNSEDAWACQAGTTADPTKISNFRPNLLDPEPVWNGMYSTNKFGTPHCILHQWDRIPAWKPIIEQHYG